MVEFGRSVKHTRGAQFCPVRLRRKSYEADAAFSRCCNTNLQVRGQRQFRFPTQPWHSHIIGVHIIRVLPTLAVRTGSIDPTAPLSNDNKTNNIQANRKNWLRSEQAPDNTPAQCTTLPNSAQFRPSPEATPAPSPHPPLPNHPSVQLAPPARGYIKSPRRAKNLRHSNTKMPSAPAP